MTVPSGIHLPGTSGECPLPTCLYDANQNDRVHQRLTSCNTVSWLILNKTIVPLYSQLCISHVLLLAWKTGSWKILMGQTPPNVKPGIMLANVVIIIYKASWRCTYRRKYEIEMEICPVRFVLFHWNPLYSGRINKSLLLEVMVHLLTQKLMSVNQHDRGQGDYLFGFLFWSQPNLSCQFQDLHSFLERTIKGVWLSHALQLFDYFQARKQTRTAVLALSMDQFRLTSSAAE